MAICEKDINKEREKIKKLGRDKYYKHVLAAKANLAIFPALLAMITVTASLLIAFISSEKDIGKLVYILAVTFTFGIYLLAREIEKGIIAIDLYDVDEQSSKSETVYANTGHDCDRENLAGGEKVYKLICFFIILSIIVVVLLACLGLHVTIILEGIMNMAFAMVDFLLKQICLFISSASDNIIALIILALVLIIMKLCKTWIVKIIERVLF